MKGRRNTTHKSRLEKSLTHFSELFLLQLVLAKRVGIAAEGVGVRGVRVPGGARGFGGLPSAASSPAPFPSAAWGLPAGGADPISGDVTIARILGRSPTGASGTDGGGPAHSAHPDGVNPPPHRCPRARETWGCSCCERKKSKWAKRFGFPFKMHVGGNCQTHSPNNRRELWKTLLKLPGPDALDALWVQPPKMLHCAPDSNLERRCSLSWVQPPKTLQCPWLSPPKRLWCPGSYTLKMRQCTPGSAPERCCSAQG